MRESVARGDALGWFESLYAQANDSASAIQWADQVVNPYLERWLGEHSTGKGLALDVGCGLGDNAAALAAAGFSVTASMFRQLLWRGPSDDSRHCLSPG